MGSDETTDRIAAVTAELKEVRQRRMDVQRLAAGHRTAEMALERVLRDRSTGTSPEADQLIQKIRDLHDELASEFDDMTTTLGNVGRLRVSRPGEDFSEFDSLSQRIQETRARVHSSTSQARKS